MRFSTVKDLLRSIEVLSNEWGDPDIAFFAAGISDYIPVRSEGKIPSGSTSLTLEMEKAPKIIVNFKRLFGDTFIVGFKAESSVSEEELMKRAFKKLKKVGMGAIVANDLKDVSKDRSKVILLTPEKEAYRVEGGKTEIAGFLIEKISELRKGWK